MPPARSTTDVPEILRGLLAHLENCDSTWWLDGNYRPTDSTFPNVAARVWPLQCDGEWHISIRFSEATPDGRLEREVFSGRRFAAVDVRVDEQVLTELRYSDGSEPCKDPVVVSAGAVLYVREWVRVRVLPAVIQAKRLHDTADERRVDQLDLLRKKYLPWRRLSDAVLV